MEGLSIERLRPLADSLYMTLELPEDSAVAIRGKAKHELNLPEMVGLSLTVAPTVVSSFVCISGEDLGILLHIKGNLYLFAFHSEFTRTVVVHVVDGAKVGYPLKEVFERANVRSYTGAMRQVQAGVVASFEKPETGDTWKPHTPNLD